MLSVGRFATLSGPWQRTIQRLLCSTLADIPQGAFDRPGQRFIWIAVLESALLYLPRVVRISPAQPFRDGTFLKPQLGDTVLNVTRRKRIAMIHPKFPPSFWGFGFIKDIGGFEAVMPPLGLATLAALTPDTYDVQIIDENIEPIDLDIDADLIVLSAMAIQEQRLFELADALRARGQTVCMGGPICNVLPERCRPHCDVLFEGEGEYNWPKFLDEWENGRHQGAYIQIDKIDLADSPPPRVDLLNVGAYRVGCIQTTRGCPFSCEFCDIIVTYGRKVRSKPIANVLRELQAWADAGMDFVTLADDNLVGDRKYAKKMLKAVGDWNRARKVPISLYAEMSVDCARDNELLALMRWANITEAFIGIESPRKASLKETKKFQNAAADLVTSIKTLQSYGMVTVAGMIVGFDNDDIGIFEDQYVFLQEAGVPIAMLGILQAIPRTPLYKRLEKDGRLRSAVQGNNTLSFTNIEPLNLSYAELIDGYRELFQRIYEWDAVAETLACERRAVGKVSGSQIYSEVAGAHPCGYAQADGHDSGLLC